MLILVRFLPSLTVSVYVWVLRVSFFLFSLIFFFSFSFLFTYHTPLHAYVISIVHSGLHYVEYYT